MIVGTRGSALALAQTKLVTDALGGDVEIRVIKTAGDRSAKPIRELEDGAFVAAIERALRSGECDLAVHSLKDLPVAGADDLVVAAIPARGDPRDALITRSRGGLSDLPPRAVVGTSSPRRAAFVRALRPDATVCDVRGNVDTRMRKVADGELDAVMLAVVGLMRLGFAVGDHEALDVRDCPPAPGQGALAVQVRADDVKLREHVARTLDDPQTRRAVTAERALLALLGASCDIPLGALARVEGGGDVLLYAALATESGIRRTTARARDPQAAAERAAEALEVAVGA